MANIFKKLKKAVKKIGKVISKVAPVAAFIPGVGTAIAAGVGGLSGALGKAGKYAQGYASKLNAVQNMMKKGDKGAPDPTDGVLAQNEMPPETQRAPASSGISGNTLLLAGAALAAILLLNRRR